MSRPDVVVVGAGVIGCATAFALARAGAAVAVLERDDLGRHASRAAAGMLAPLTESDGEGPASALGLRSLALFPEFVAELRELSGIDPLLREIGILRAARTDEVAALRLRAKQLAVHDCLWLEPEEARKREPLLAPDLAGALWSPREAHVNSLLLTRACARAAERRGARLEVGSEVLGLLRAGDRVTGVRTTAGELSAGDVVLCCGAWTRAAESWLGARLPVEPIKGQMLALEAPNPPPRSILWGADVYLVPREDGAVAVGSTVERAGFDARPTAEGLAGLITRACALAPALGRCAFREAWAGLRPGTPDHLPLLGPLPGVAGLVLAAGHYRSGVLLAPLTALAVADWVLEGRRWRDLEPLDPARFQS